MFENFCIAGCICDAHIVSGLCMALAFKYTHSDVC